MEVESKNKWMILSQFILYFYKRNSPKHNDILQTRMVKRIGTETRIKIVAYIVRIGINDAKQTKYPIYWDGRPMYSIYQANIYKFIYESCY